MVELHQNGLRAYIQIGQSTQYDNNCKHSDKRTNQVLLANSHSLTNEGKPHKQKIKKRITECKSCL